MSQGFNENSLPNRDESNAMPKLSLRDLRILIMLEISSNSTRDEISSILSYLSNQVQNVSYNYKDGYEKTKLISDLKKLIENYENQKNNPAISSEESLLDIL